MTLSEKVLKSIEGNEINIELYITRDVCLLKIRSIEPLHNKFYAPLNFQNCDLSR